MKYVNRKSGARPLASGGSLRDLRYATALILSQFRRAAIEINCPLSMHRNAASPTHALLNASSLWFQAAFMHRRNERAEKKTQQHEAHTLNQIHFALFLFCDRMSIANQYIRKCIYTCYLLREKERTHSWGLLTRSNRVRKCDFYTRVLDILN